MTEKRPSLGDWIEAFRPRTLLLAVSTVILGNAIALQQGALNGIMVVLTLLLAVGIQTLSNLANDLGDYQKGTDTTGNREGPMRSLQSGKISAKQMKSAVVVTSIVTAAIGIILILNVAKQIGWLSAILMLLLGAIAIAAALFYTIGRNPYGYRGWGDLLAFLFFGPVAVIGTYFLQRYQLNFNPLLPAIGNGLISTMILNINNMRDISNDKASGKKTIASILGLKRARLYHAILTVTVFLCFIGYSLIYANAPAYRYIYLLAFIFQLLILKNIYNKSDRYLDPYLKLTAMSGFMISVVFAVCINI